MGRRPLDSKTPLTTTLQLQELRDVHREMARLFVQGWTPSEVAKHFGYTLGRVSIIRQSPCFIEHMARLQNAADEDVIKARSGVNDEVQRLSQKAAAVLASYLEDANGNLVKAVNPDHMKLQFKAAQDILDRAGVKSTTVIRVEDAGSTDAAKKQEGLASIYDELRAGAVAPGSLEAVH